MHWLTSGVDGLTTFVATEPYSRSNGNSGGGGGGFSNFGGGSGGFGNAGGSAAGARGARGRGARAGRGQGRQASGAPGGMPKITGKSMEEKMSLCCGDFNSPKGCTRPHCVYLHKCSYADRATHWICLQDHSKMQH